MEVLFQEHLHVMEVDSGMNAWQAAGNELVNNQ